MARHRSMERLTHAVPLVLFAVACSRIERSEVWEMEGPLSDLVVEVESGRIELVVGDTLQVTRTGLAGEGEVTVVADGGTVRVEGRCARFLPCGVDLRITVPERVAANVALGEGVFVSNDVAAVVVELDRGRVEVNGGMRIVAEVGTGSVHARLQEDAEARFVVAVGDVDLALEGEAWALDVQAREEVVSRSDGPSEPSGSVHVHAPSGRAIVKTLAAES